MSVTVIVHITMMWPTINEPSWRRLTFKEKAEYFFHLKQKGVEGTKERVMPEGGWCQSVIVPL